MSGSWRPGVQHDREMIAYPGDEFIVVLDGAFAMMDGQGRGTPAHKGQGVAFRSGAPVS